MKGLTVWGQVCTVKVDFFVSVWFSQALIDLTAFKSCVLLQHLILFFPHRTPFHADVFRSYSWSANICGRKKWLLYPAGQEEYLKDRHGNLPFDVTAPSLQDRSIYPRYDQSQPPVEIVQEAGEIVFIPSGWHHQVYNLVKSSILIFFHNIERQSGNRLGSGQAFLLPRHVVDVKSRNWGAKNVERFGRKSLISGYMR